MEYRSKNEWLVVKRTRSQHQDLAAVHALGALDGEDARTFLERLTADPAAQNEFRSFQAVAEGLARSVAVPPPAGLKETILRRAAVARARAEAAKRIEGLIPPGQDGLGFLKGAAEADWIPLQVPGAFVKLLSFDPTTRYAVVLGKLEPGSRYPEHTHVQAEDIFMLSGDLHVGNETIHAGDFHHAESGSRHGVNWSETGCTLLAVLSQEDLMRQLIPG